MTIAVRRVGGGASRGFASILKMSAGRTGRHGAEIETNAEQACAGARASGKAAAENRASAGNEEPTGRQARECRRRGSRYRGHRARTAAQSLGRRRVERDKGQGTREKKNVISAARGRTSGYAASTTMMPRACRAAAMRSAGQASFPVRRQARHSSFRPSDRFRNKLPQTSARAR
jgi:hypothetical protein